MLYIVGNGAGELKLNYIYAYPNTKKSFSGAVRVMNIASGNIYEADTSLVGKDEVFTNFGKALEAAGVSMADVNLCHNFQSFIDGKFTEAYFRYNMKPNKVFIFQGNAVIPNIKYIGVSFMKKDIENLPKEMKEIKKKEMEEFLYDLSCQIDIKKEEVRMSLKVEEANLFAPYSQLSALVELEKVCQEFFLDVFEIKTPKK